MIIRYLDPKGNLHSVQATRPETSLTSPQKALDSATAKRLQEEIREVNLTGYRI